MRLNSTLRDRINTTVERASDERYAAYRAEHIEEKQRCDSWKVEQLDKLRSEIRPIVYEWAKKLRKNYSKYQWEDMPSSEILTDKVMSTMMFEKSWSFPQVYSKKLQEIGVKRDKFNTFLADLKTDALLQVSFIKTAPEFKVLLMKLEDDIKAYED